MKKFYKENRFYIGVAEIVLSFAVLGSAIPLSKTSFWLDSFIILVFSLAELLFVSGVVTVAIEFHDSYKEDLPVKQAVVGEFPNKQETDMASRIITAGCGYKMEDVRQAIEELKSKYGEDAFNLALNNKEE